MGQAAIDRGALPRGGGPVAMGLRQSDVGRPGGHEALVALGRGFRPRGGGPGRDGIPRGAGQGQADGGGNPRGGQPCSLGWRRNPAGVPATASQRARVSNGRQVVAETSAVARRPADSEWGWPAEERLSARRRSARGGRMLRSSSDTTSAHER